MHSWIGVPPSFPKSAQSYDLLTPLGQMSYNSFESEEGLRKADSVFDDIDGQEVADRPVVGQESAQRALAWEEVQRGR